MWMSWKKTVLGFVAAVAGMALVGALLERPLSTPLPQAAVASVFGGDAYGPCWIEGTGLCPTPEGNQTCSRSECPLPKGDDPPPCPIVGQEGIYVMDPATFKNAQNSPEEHGYREVQQAQSSFYCWLRYECANECVASGDVYVCKKDNDLPLIPGQQSRTETFPNYQSDVCNWP